MSSWAWPVARPSVACESSSWTSTHKPTPTSSLDPVRTPYTTSDVLFDGREGVAGDAIVASGWDSLISLIPSERAFEHRATRTGRIHHTASAGP